MVNINLNVYIRSLREFIKYMETIRVNLSSNGYNILIDKELLQRIGDILIQEKDYCKTLLITDENIDKIYGDIVSESLSRKSLMSDASYYNRVKSRRPLIRQ